MKVEGTPNGEPVAVRSRGGDPVGASANVAAGAMTLTLASQANRRTKIKGIVIDGLGATGASVIEVTVTGLIGGTMRFKVTVPAGATTAIARAVVTFGDGAPASADGTDIVVSVPSFGAGNTSATGYAWGCID